MTDFLLLKSLSHVNEAIFTLNHPYDTSLLPVPFTPFHPCHISCYIFQVVLYDLH
jgi:hypothetical protein